MAENSKKWVGNTKVVTTKFGNIYKLGLTAEHLELLKSNLNERGWVNVAVASTRDGGGTSWIDEYQASGNTGAAPVNGGEPDLPF